MADRQHLRRASAANTQAFVACALYDESSDEEEVVESEFESSDSKKRLRRSAVFDKGPPLFFCLERVFKATKTTMMSSKTKRIETASHPTKKTATFRTVKKRAVRFRHLE